MYRIMSFDDRRCKVDHAVLQENSGHVASVTLCDRAISGRKWFLRGHGEFDPRAGFNCKRCVAKLAQLKIKLSKLDLRIMRAGFPVPSSLSTVIVF